MNKIAIIIIAHRNPEQLFRMVTTLGNEYFDFFIHIDKKSEIKEFHSVFRNCPFQVYFTKNRINTSLMDFSLIDATMQPVIEAYNSANHYSYYALLTGQDYPIKSPEYIHSYLTKNYPVSFRQVLLID